MAKLHIHAALVACVLLLVGCGGRLLPTVDGPETPELIKQVGIGTRVRMIFKEVSAGFALPHWTIDEAAEQPPVPGAPARDIPRAEHEVCVVSGLRQARHVARIVGKVAVHLEDPLRAHLQRAVEPGEVGGAEALLPLPVQHVDALVGAGEAVRDLPGPVRRVVVDNEHVQVLELESA